jgi:hypothetical protein
MKHEDTPFWLVWSPTGRSPVYRHVSRRSAFAEASRLADQNEGQPFYVLEPKSLVQKTKVDVRHFGRSEAGDIPF